MPTTYRAEIRASYGSCFTEILISMVFTGSMEMKLFGLGGNMARRLAFETLNYGRYSLTGTKLCSVSSSHDIDRIILQ